MTKELWDQTVAHILEPSWDLNTPDLYQKAIQLPEYSNPQSALPDVFSDAVATIHRNALQCVEPGREKWTELLGVAGGENTGQSQPSQRPTAETGRRGPGNDWEQPPA